MECVIKGVPAGIGEPAFEKLDANLAKAVFSIGAVKSFEVGAGIAAASSDGLHNNDAYRMDEEGNVRKRQIIPAVSPEGSVTARQSLYALPSSPPLPWLRSRRL